MFAGQLLAQYARASTTVFLIVSIRYVPISAHEELRTQLQVTYWSTSDIHRQQIEIWRQAILSHHPQEKMTVISQTIFSDAFSWMKIFHFD